MRVRMIPLWVIFLAAFIFVHAGPPGSLAADSLPADFPAISRTTVSGMNIILQKTDSPAVEIALLLKSGSGIEPPSKKGTALLMNNLVYLRLKYGPQKLGEVDVTTYPDYTLITLRTTARDITSALTEFRELLSYPLYSYDIITDLKGLFLSDLKAMSAPARAYYTMVREFYGPEHPCNDQIDETLMAAVDGNDVYRWYRQTYQPQNAVLSITGGVKQTILDLEKFFRDLPTDTLDHRLLTTPVVLESDRALDYTDPNGRVAALCYGFPAPRLSDPEYPAFRIITFYLEDYFRYFEMLRVKEALFYAGYVFYTGLEKPKAPQLVFLTATDPASVPRVEELTLQLVNDLITNGIPAAEIRRVIEAMKAQEEARRHSVGGSAVRNALHYFLESRYVYDEFLTPRLEQVTTDEIKSAAAKYLRHYLRVAYVPEKMGEDY